MGYKRSRNLFNPHSAAPYGLSRTKIENFMRCQRCFYLDRRMGVGLPSTPPFTINTAIDELLKKEFDAHRAIGTPHPLMLSYGIKAVPYDHPDLNTWRHNFTGISFHHPQSNLILSGAIDDVWVNTDGQLHIVDYKATAKDGEVSLDADWQISYKRQAEIYQWLFRMNGFQVSDRAYFVYVNGRKDAQAFDAKLEFDVKILPYDGNDGWIGETLIKVKECLLSTTIPAASAECEYCAYIQAATTATQSADTGATISL